MKIVEDIQYLVDQALAHWPGSAPEQWELSMGTHAYRQLAMAYSNRDHVPTVFGLVDCRLNSELHPMGIELARKDKASAPIISFSV